MNQKNIDKEMYQRIANDSAAVWNITTSTIAPIIRVICLYATENFNDLSLRENMGISQTSNAD